MSEYISLKEFSCAGKGRVIDGYNVLQYYLWANNILVWIFDRILLFKVAAKPH